MNSSYDSFHDKNVKLLIEIKMYSYYFFYKKKMHKKWFKMRSMTSLETFLYHKECKFIKKQN